MKSAGFSFIELILVIAIISIVAASSVPFLSNTINRSSVQTTRERLLSSLTKAQVYSKQGKLDAVWGVCLSGGAIRLYRGSCNSPAYTEDFQLPSSVTVSGLTDITFDQLRGEPASAASITVSSGIKSYIVSVNQAGLISSN